MVPGASLGHLLIHSLGGSLSKAQLSANDKLTPTVTMKETQNRVLALAHSLCFVLFWTHIHDCLCCAAGVKWGL